MFQCHSNSSIVSSSTSPTLLKTPSSSSLKCPYLSLSLCLPSLLSLLLVQVQSRSRGSHPVWDNGPRVPYLSLPLSPATLIQQTLSQSLSLSLPSPLSLPHTPI